MRNEILQYFLFSGEFCLCLGLHAILNIFRSLLSRFHFKLFYKTTSKIITNLIEWWANFFLISLGNFSVYLQFCTHII